MLPSKRWAEALGVAKYDKAPGRPIELSDFTRVEIPLASNIGIPAVPTVSDGERVSAGELIAEAASGLSIPQHASMSGRASIKQNRVIIYKD